MTLDQLMLLFGAAEVLLLVAVAAGLLARRRHTTERIWAAAYRLAITQPDLVDAIDLDAVESPPAAVIDQLGHSELVDRVLAHEETEARLRTLLFTATRTHQAQLASLRQQLIGAEVEIERERRAKHRHWATIRRQRHELEQTR